MNLSGILVVTTPEKMGNVCDALNALEGVSVYHTDEATARLVVVQEAGSVNDEVNGLKTIKAVPGVVMAEMVNHYFGDDAEQFSPDEIPADIDEMTGLSNAVPASLNE
jgi:nitrate reductase NapD